MDEQVDHVDDTVVGEADMDVSRHQSMFELLRIRPMGEGAAEVLRRAGLEVDDELYRPRWERY